MIIIKMSYSVIHTNTYRGLHQNSMFLSLSIMFGGHDRIIINTAGCHGDSLKQSKTLPG